MQAVTTIGLDIAKSVLQVHGIDAKGKVVVCLGVRFRLGARFERADGLGSARKRVVDILDRSWPPHYGGRL